MPARASSSGEAQHIFVVPVAAHGDDVRMLDDQKLIGNFAALAPLDQRALQLERFRVADAAQGRAPLQIAASRNSTALQALIAIP